MERINKQFNFILVSKSPRRSKLLKAMGLDFTIGEIELEEIFPKDINVKKAAKYLAELKFDEACETIKHDCKTIFITSDTTVILKNKLLGKPTTFDEAKNMLMSLSGNSHFVITGVCLGNKYFKKCFSVKSKVYFDKLHKEEIDYYIHNYKVLDKAGAYGIQDWIGIVKISKIKGSYTNIMGLPTQELYRNLKKLIRKKD